MLVSAPLPLEFLKNFHCTSSHLSMQVHYLDALLLVVLQTDSVRGFLLSWHLLLLFYCQFRCDECDGSIHCSRRDPDLRMAIRSNWVVFYSSNSHLWVCVLFFVRKSFGPNSSWWNNCTGSTLEHMFRCSLTRWWTWEIQMMLEDVWVCSWAFLRWVLSLDRLFPARSTQRLAGSKL